MDKNKLGAIKGILIVIIIIIIILVSFVSLCFLIANKFHATQNVVKPQPKRSQTIPPNDLLDKNPYYSATYGLGIDPPKDWVMEETGEQSETIIFKKLEDDRNSKNSFVTKIDVSIGFTPINLDSYSIVMKNKLQKTLTNFKLIEDENIDVNGNPARLVGGTFKSGPVDARNLEIIIVYKGKSYIVAGTARQSDWNKYENIIKSSILTFTLDEK